MPDLVARHRQTTMTQQFGYAEAEEEKESDDESLPPNWGRFQDPSTGRIIFRHSGTMEIVLKKKDLFKKQGARKNPPAEDANPPTDATRVPATPLKKRKVKTEVHDLVDLVPDTIPSFPPTFVTPTSEHRRMIAGGTNVTDPIVLVDDSSVEEEEGNVSDLSGLPQTNEFDFIRHFKTDPSSDSSDADEDAEDADDDSETLV